MIVSTVRAQNENILIVSDKFWEKIVCDIFRHFTYLSQVHPRPKSKQVEWLPFIDIINSNLLASEIQGISCVELSL